MVKPSQNFRAAKAARRALAALGTPRKKRRTNAAPVEAVEAEDARKRLARHEETMKRSAAAQLQPRGAKRSKTKTKDRPIDGDRSEDAKGTLRILKAGFVSNRSNKAPVVWVLQRFTLPSMLPFFVYAVVVVSSPSPSMPQ
ncbi:hypothetical protein GN958_ATG15517 [Phytophthora infestans]|uniref:Uncharacterized protein n=1 Tax=Phytophthora infestans TaxID=4787 RepID=A0A8S9U7Q9_PHYIN|nr:hypothetical protein GN958_ATG15517 [Phytophthora infestans]